MTEPIPLPSPYMGVHEIAEVLGVSRQRADQLTRERGFPLPMATLHMGRVWKRSAVQRWALLRGRSFYLG